MSSNNLLQLLLEQLPMLLVQLGFYHLRAPAQSVLVAADRENFEGVVVAGRRAQTGRLPALLPGPTVGGHARGNQLTAPACGREATPAEKILTGASFVLTFKTKESAGFVRRGVLDLGDFGKNSSTKN